MKTCSFIIVAVFGSLLLGCQDSNINGPVANEPEATFVAARNQQIPTIPNPVDGNADVATDADVSDARIAAEATDIAAVTAPESRQFKFSYVVKDPSLAFNAYLNVTGVVEYTATDIRTKTGIYSHFVIAISATLTTPDDPSPQWTVTSKTEGQVAQADNINDSDAIPLLQTSAPVQGRDDGMRLNISFRAKGSLLEIDNVWVSLSRRLPVKYSLQQ